MLGSEYLVTWEQSREWAAQRTPRPAARGMPQPSGIAEVAPTAAAEA
jgi:hypothetical protein